MYTHDSFCSFGVRSGQVFLNFSLYGMVITTLLLTCFNFDLLLSNPRLASIEIQIHGVIELLKFSTSFDVSSLDNLLGLASTLFCRSTRNRPVRNFDYFNHIYEYTLWTANFEVFKRSQIFTDEYCDVIVYQLITTTNNVMELESKNRGEADNEIRETFLTDFSKSIWSGFHCDSFHFFETATKADASSIKSPLIVFILSFVLSKNRYFVTFCKKELCDREETEKLTCIGLS